MNPVPSVHSLTVISLIETVPNLKNCLAFYYSVYSTTHEDPKKYDFKSHYQMKTAHQSDHS